MNIKQLRKIIREIVETVPPPVVEADGESSGTKVPATFEAFRDLLGKAMKKSGAPDDLVEEVMDTDLEGGGVAQVCFSAWREFDSSRGDNGLGDADAWETLAYVFSDAVRDMASEHSNAMNYAPGRKAGALDVEAVASGVERYMLQIADGTDSPEGKDNSEFMTTAKMIAEILTDCGGASGVKVSPDGRSVAFSATRSDIDELFAAEALKWHESLEPESAPHDELPTVFTDKVNGVKASLEDGVVRLSR